MSARYTLFIGSKNTSSWSLRPWLAMKMAGLVFEEVLIPLRRPQTREAIEPHSPSGKVPALRIEEGRRVQTVWDSLAICETLAEHHPNARLWPSDGTARAEARSGGFLFGPFTIADAFYAPVATRFETYGIHLPAVAQAYTQRILALGPMGEWKTAAKAEVAARS